MMKKPIIEYAQEVRKYFQLLESRASVEVVIAFSKQKEKVKEMTNEILNKQ